MTEVFKAPKKSKMAQSMTLRKHLFSDACIIFRFSFAQYKMTTDGKDVINKFYQMKLKVNTERIDCIRKVTYCKRGADGISNFN